MSYEIIKNENSKIGKIKIKAGYFYVGDVIILNDNQLHSLSIVIQIRPQENDLCYFCLYTNTCGYINLDSTDYKLFSDNVLLINK